MPSINFTKGWPSITAVDLAIPVNDATIVEGMGISPNTSSQWIKGIPKGALPYVTGPEQFPTALDVYRQVATTFNNDDGYPAGDAEMGRQAMGGVALSNPLEFQTDQYDTGTPLAQGQVVYVPNTGKFTVATDSSDHQIVGVCRLIGSSLAAGNNPTFANWQGGKTVATIVSLPSLLLP